MSDPIRSSDLFIDLEEEERAALAVSGGPDSMALLLLADRWRTHRLRQQLEAPELVVLTVDHGLRPEAAEECRFVAARAEELGYAAQVLKWEGEKPESRVQELARERRYQLLAAACHSLDIDVLLTAHQMDDQAETFLMRLGRGSGLDGLSSIPRESRRYGVHLLRPLLDIAKQQLVDELDAAGWRYIEDPSNDDTAYERVRLRQCRAELQKLGLSAEMIALSARRLARARRALEADRDSFLKINATFSSYGGVRVDQLALSDCSEEVAIRALGRLLRNCGGNLEQPNMAQLEKLCTTMRDDFTGNHTLAGCRIVSKGDIWLIVREAGRITELDKPISPGECIFWDNRFIVCAGETAPGDITVGPLAKPEGLKPLVEAERLKQLPMEALASLLTFRRKGEVIAVPVLDFWRDEAVAMHLSARYITAEEGFL